MGHNSTASEKWLAYCTLVSHHALPFEPNIGVGGNPF